MSAASWPTRTGVVAIVSGGNVSPETLVTLEE